jgi:hypothetical protein
MIFGGKRKAEISGRAGYHSHVIIYDTCIKHLYLYFIQVRHRDFWFFVRSRMTPNKDQFNPFLPQHRIAHFWAILSPCNLCCGILVFIESPKFGRFYENQNSSNGLCAMGSIFIE